MANLIINQLQIRAKVGTNSQERSWAQKLSLILELGFDCSRAILEDNLSYTIDYVRLANELQEWLNGREWNLLETLGSDIADWILTNFHPHSVEVVITKFELPLANGVTFKIKKSS